MPRPYVPTCVGFCLYIRHRMLAEFGLLDEVYGRGYNEENDFIMRCNRRGYRAVLANHAFVYHVGNASFSHSQFKRQEQANQNILLQRYPEYSKAIERHLHSVEFEAQRLVSGFIPDRCGCDGILFRVLESAKSWNGTSELTRRIIAEFVERHSNRYCCRICCSLQAWKFHTIRPDLRRLAYAGELHAAGAPALIWQQFGWRIHGLQPICRI